MVAFNFSGHALVFFAAFLYQEAYGRPFPPTASDVSIPDYASSVGSDGLPIVFLSPIALPVSKQ